MRNIHVTAAVGCSCQVANDSSTSWSSTLCQQQWVQSRSCCRHDTQHTASTVKAGLYHAGHCRRAGCHVLARSAVSSAFSLSAFTLGAESVVLLLRCTGFHDLQALKINVDMLKLIQLGLTFTNAGEHLAAGTLGSNSSSAQSCSGNRARAAAQEQQLQACQVLPESSCYCGGSVPCAVVSVTSSHAVHSMQQQPASEL